MVIGRKADCVVTKKGEVGWISARLRKQQCPTAERESSKPGYAWGRGSGDQSGLVWMGPV